MENAILVVSLLICMALSACSSGNGSDSNATSTGSGSSAQPTARRGDLIRAVVDDNNIQVNQLLDEGADVNEDLGHGSDHLTPLIVAAATQEADIAKILINRGATLSIKLDLTYQGYTAAEIASYSGMDEVASAIYQAEAAKNGVRK